MFFLVFIRKFIRKFFVIRGLYFGILLLVMFVRLDGSFDFVMIILEVVIFLDMLKLDRWEWFKLDVLELVGVFLKNVLEYWEELKIFEFLCVRFDECWLLFIMFFIVIKWL